MEPKKTIYLRENGAWKNLSYTENYESQSKMIFDYLMTGARITGLEALKWFGTIKCSNRIGDIEKMYNVTINREWKTIQTKFGKKRVVEYFLNPIPRVF